MTSTEPKTPQEWNQAALEALGWTKRANAVRVRVELGYDNYFWADPGGLPHKSPPPLLTSVDACLKHLVPVMKGMGLSIIITQWENTWTCQTCHFVATPCSAYCATGYDTDLALAIVKAFVRSSREKNTT